MCGRRGGGQNTYSRLSRAAPRRSSAVTCVAEPGISFAVMAPAATLSMRVKMAIVGVIVWTWSAARWVLEATFIGCNGGRRRGATRRSARSQQRLAPEQWRATALGPNSVSPRVDYTWHVPVGAADPSTKRNGTSHSSDHIYMSLLNSPDIERGSYEEEVHAVIIGAAAAGLAAAASIRAAGLRCINLERNATPGDRWRKRYARLHLHDVAEFCQLPYWGMPDFFPRYVPSADYANYLDAYALACGADVRGGMDVTGVARANEREVERGFRWRVLASDTSGRAAAFLCKHVVFADGLYNRPRLPDGVLSSSDAFHGDVIHSSEYVDSRPFAGKRVVVCGFGNSGMEIALDLAEVAEEVVALVRDPASRGTVPLGPYGDWQRLPRYLELPRHVATELARTGWLGGLLAAVPSILADIIDKLKDAWLARRAFQEWERMGAPRGDLRPFGLATLPGDGSCGYIEHIHKSSKVATMDVGAVKHVIAGNIRIENAALSGLTPKGAVVRAQGHAATVLPCDAIICCTGYHTLEQFRTLLPPDARQALHGGIDGFLVEPALRGSAIMSGDPTAVEGVWFVYGRLAQIEESARRLGANIVAAEARLERKRARRPVQQNLEA